MPRNGVWALLHHKGDSQMSSSGSVEQKAGVINSGAGSVTGLSSEGDREDWLATC